MLTCTFVHLKSLGPSTERRLWENGIADWSAFRRQSHLTGIAPARKAVYDTELALAQTHLDLHNPRYFADCLHTRDHWRLFETFGARALYLDTIATSIVKSELNS